MIGSKQKEHIEMSKLEEYIKRYEGLHTGKDAYYQKDTLIPAGSNKIELFSGVQFSAKFPKYIRARALQKRCALTVLDYGCGLGHAPWRATAELPNGVWGMLRDKVKCFYLYDPAVPHFSQPPPDGWLFDIVACADVMEHIPEEHVDEVLENIKKYCQEDGYLLFSISGNPAFKKFIDGENLHCTIQDSDWWSKKISSVCNRDFTLLHNGPNGTSIVSGSRQ